MSDDAVKPPPPPEAGSAGEGSAPPPAAPAIEPEAADGVGGSNPPATEHDGAKPTKPARPPRLRSARPRRAHSSRPARGAARRALPGTSRPPARRPEPFELPKIPRPGRMPRLGPAPKRGLGAGGIAKAESAPPPVSDPPPDSAPPTSLRMAPVSTQRQVGRCELFAEIAHGGMATIYLGRWLGAGGFSKIVAVKALHPQYARDPEFKAMFLDEARVVARIRHPNVMPTIDLVDDEGELFIVMEYVEGVTLAHLMRQMRRRRERVPVPMALRIIVGVLQGLHAAHEATGARGEPLCVIHRDVSPENILVGADGHPRLLDFGIASALGRYGKTRDGQVKGKLSYLTPEQVLGEKLTRRADVFSASVVLWQALAGRKLFHAENIAEITHKILSGHIEPPSKRGKGVSAELDRIVVRGLERNPSRRWETAADMAEAIERLGGLATHREVATWVRQMAGRRLEAAAKLVVSAERRAADTDPDGLDRPLSIRPMPPDEPAQPSSEAPWDVSEEDVSHTDATLDAVSTQTTVAGSSQLRLYAAVAAALVLLAVVALWAGLSGSESTGPAQATSGVVSSRPTTTAEVPPPPPHATLAPSVSSARAVASAPASATASASASPSASPPASSAPPAQSGPRPRRRPHPRKPKPSGTFFPSDI